MTTERELLELAAKAAGIEGEWERDTAFIQERYQFITPYSNQGMMTGITWNPLTDDGDALRLAVKLNLLVGCHSTEAWAQFFGLDGEWFTAKEPHEADPNAATRRAIVRAAAEIGRAMK